MELCSRNGGEDQTSIYYKSPYRRKVERRGVGWVAVRSPTPAGLEAACVCQLLGSEHRGSRDLDVSATLESSLLSLCPASVPFSGSLTGLCDQEAPRSRTWAQTSSCTFQGLLGWERPQQKTVAGWRSHHRSLRRSSCSHRVAPTLSSSLAPDSAGVQIN